MRLKLQYVLSNVSAAVGSSGDQNRISKFGCKMLCLNSIHKVFLSYVRHHSTIKVLFIPVPVNLCRASIGAILPEKRRLRTRGLVIVVASCGCFGATFEGRGFGG